MSKLIKVTDEYLNQIKKDFEDALSSGKFSDGKITFTKTIGSIDRKATIFFTEIAWLKMQTLIREYDKEVAWHGIAKRVDDETKDEYIISDIIVYPQEVTGATVTTDQNEYQMWLMNQDDDVFNNIRFQGHSHVNMGTTPSSVDTSLYDGILAQLSDDMFYIFMIWNKRGEKTIKIYDMKKNVLFETSDCTIEIMDDNTGIERWLKNAKSMVKDKVYSTPANNVMPYGYGSSSYSGYYGGSTSHYGGNTSQYGGNSATYGSYSSPKNNSEKKQEDCENKKKKRKGKRSNHKNQTKQGRQMTMFSDGWYDDEEYQHHNSFFAR